MTRDIHKSSAKAAKSRTSLVERFVLAAVCTIPLQKAFTVSVGFPLKLSEIFFSIAFALSLLGFRRGVDNFMRREQRLLLALIVVTGISTLFALVRASPLGDPQGYTRSIESDAILYFGYAILVFIAWTSIVQTNIQFLVSSISIAVHIAALACIIQYILWLNGQESLLKSFNFVLVFGNAYNSAIPRNGSFMEGNYLGFFGGVALLIMIRFKKYLGIVSAGFCILYSQSTNAIIALVLAVLIGIVLKPRVRWHLQVGGIALVAVAFIAIFPATRTFISYQLAKLGFAGSSGAANMVENIDDSIDIRGAKIQTGFDMFASNPLLGVGPGRFGVWFDEFVKDNRFPSEYFSKTGRHIVENAYVQILSELGLIAFIILIIFFLRLVRKIYNINTIDFVLCLFVALSLNTAPSWTSLTIWLAFGYLGAVIITNSRANSRRRITQRYSIDE